MNIHQDFVTFFVAKLLVPLKSFFKTDLCILKLGCFSKAKVHLSFYIIEIRNTTLQHTSAVDVLLPTFSNRGQHSPRQRWLVKDTVMILHYCSDNESDLFRVAVCLLLQGPEGKPGPPGNRGRHGKKVRTVYASWCSFTMKLICG